MNNAVFDETCLAELVLAKMALQEGLYTLDDYAVVARACSVAQALQVGIKTGILSSHMDTQAAFFVSLGLPGRPAMGGVPFATATADGEESSVNQHAQGRRRRRRRTGTSRPREAEQRP